MRSLLDLLTENKDQVKPALIYYENFRESRVLTYQNILNESMTVAHNLKRHGVGGQPVLLSLPSGPEYVFSFFGILLAGAIPVPMPVLELLSAQDFSDRLTEVAKCTRAPIVISDARTLTAVRQTQVEAIDIQSLLHRPNATALKTSASEAAANDTCLIQFSSGSTQEPKGVVLTHAQVLSNVKQMRSGMAVTDQDVLATWLPLYHDMGLIGGCLAPLFNRVTVHMMNPLDFLTAPHLWMRFLSEKRITITLGPDFYYRSCVRKTSVIQKSELDLSCIRLALSGAEPVSATTCREFLNYFADARLKSTVMFPVYGLAEATLGVSFPPLENSFHVERVSLSSCAQGRALSPAPNEAFTEVVSCGQSLSETELKIVDENFTEVTERTIGKIVVRAPSTTDGYFDHPEATSQLFHQGWLKTGDIGFMADQCLYILGREKDIIKLNGKTYHPADLERKIAEVKGFKLGRSAASSCLDKLNQREKVSIVVETSEILPWRRKALRKAICSKVGRLIPLEENNISIVPSCTLSRTTSGKVRRFKLREALENGAIARTEKLFLYYWLRSKQDLKRIAVGVVRQRLLRRAKSIRKYLSRLLRPQPVDAVGESLRQIMADTLNLKVTEVTLTRPLVAYNLDSLKIVDLTTRLSCRWGEIPIAKFIEFKTLGDVRAYILAEQTKPRVAFSKPITDLNLQALEQGYLLKDLNFEEDVRDDQYWAPPGMAPLTYLPSYGLFDEDQKRRYNQLFALAICEQFIWFETEMLCEALKKLPPLPDEAFNAALENIISEEEKHSQMFWALLEKAAPQFYPKRSFYFFDKKSVSVKLASLLMKWPTGFLVWIWMAIFFEERTLDYSRQYMKTVKDPTNPAAPTIDALFAQIHAFHIKDEVRHLQMDCHFLNQYYDNSSNLKRKLAAKMVVVMMKNFTSPHRISRRILKQLGEEFPALKATLVPALIKELPQLGRSREFHQMAFSFKAVGRSLQLMSQYDELDPVWPLFIGVTKEEAQKRFANLRS